MSYYSLISLMPKFSFDPDAQAFITAAGITDNTQKNAINTLVLALKGYSIWTKMKAIYPIVGGTESSHKFNLKDPRDLNAAFRLQFATGWTHSATGMKPNGATWADTFFNLSTQTTATNISGGAYIRDNTITAGASFGAVNTGTFNGLQITPKFTDNNTYFPANNFITNGVGNFVTDTRGLFVVSKTGATQTQLFRNGSLIRTASPTTSNTTPNLNVVIGARRESTVINSYETREMAFVYFGDTLNSTEIANFYTAVQAFQTTLGRQVGVPIVSDADAQAFLNAAVIEDLTQANAINDLVIGLKADGLWTKMKAIYPIVGGTASSHKFNLKNPLDTNAAFRASFVGGITHSSTGVKGNGINAYFDTWIIPSNLFTSVSGGSMFCYIRNNTQTGTDLGAFQAGVNYRMQLGVRNTSNQIAGAALSNNFILEANTDSRGFWGVTRPPSSGTYHLIKNTNSSSNTDSYFEPNAYLKGLALGVDLTSQIAYSDHELAFVCVADGLTTTEAQTLRTINLTFQTTLGRQV